MTTASRPDPAGQVSGVLHVIVAFDWGDEIDLDHAQKRSLSQLHALPRKSRTPSSIAYRPLPLRSQLPLLKLELAELGNVSAEMSITSFDFGAVSAAMRIPFQMSKERLSKLAGSLAESANLIDAVRRAAEPLFESIKPAIQNPVWSDINEEYFVFQLHPALPESSPENLLEQESAWLAGLVRLEAEPLSAGEVAEALRLRLSYSPRDLFVPDWAAAVIIDDDCDELLDAIAFANLQLQEYRHIDSRLDRRLQETYGLISRLARTRLPFWRSHGRTIRVLGELKVEANVMLERTSDVLKLVGDPYLSRAYHLLAARLHLDEWGLNIRRTLAVLEGTYQVISGQSAAYRIEALEIAVIVLILLELLFALVHK